MPLVLYEIKVGVIDEGILRDHPEAVERALRHFISGATRLKREYARILREGIEGRR